MKASKSNTRVNTSPTGMPISSQMVRPLKHCPAPQVIKAFPDYPKIRKDILEKARIGLRP